MVKRAQHGGEEKLRYITMSQSFFVEYHQEEKRYNSIPDINCGYRLQS